MAALPYIQLYVADYLADTMHLTTEEHGAYLLLIMNYWQTGKPIHEKKIKSIIRINNERVTDVIETLKEFFNVDDNGLWHHKRIDAELEKVWEKSFKASQAGRKSAEKRWGNSEKVTNVITDVTETLIQNDNHTDTYTDTYTDIKESTKEKKSIKKDELTILTDYGITGDLANDFLQIRKTKKAPVTKTSMDGIQREAEKAKLTIQEAVKVSTENNWQGFKASWYANLSSSNIAKPVNNRFPDNSDAYFSGRKVYR